ncbi:MAG: GNAT family N-acetyltransferase [Clostridia bacterium]|nr:GNAT family N-acetyltransferase [Clostridia bacterium]
MLDNLKTKRCTIRKFNPSDVGGLFEILSNANVMRYIEPEFSRNQTENFMQKYGLCEEPKIFTLIYDKSKTLIGHVIYHPFKDDALEREFGNGKVFEVGVVLAEAYWNRGIGSEVIGALVDISKESGISAIVLECDKDNLASARIAQKLKFVEKKSGDAYLRLFVLQTKQE